ncbi:MAG: hypothetical protein ABI663_22305 [Chryseolinea sp.]
MRDTFSIIFLLAFVSFTCSNKQNSAATLFDVDSLTSAQIKYLTIHRAELNKTSSLGDSSGSVSFMPKDTSAWKSELEIFKVLNLVNKPINRNSYTIEIQPDTKSNLSIRTFGIKTSLPEDEKKNLPIEYLKIYYHNTVNKIRRIEGQYKELGFMNKTAQVLMMEFQPVNDTMILTSYSITGGQKMFMGDSVQYKINSSVTLTK